MKWLSNKEPGVCDFFIDLTYIHRLWLMSVGSHLLYYLNTVHWWKRENKIPCNLKEIKQVCRRQSFSQAGIARQSTEKSRQVVLLADLLGSQISCKLLSHITRWSPHRNSSKRANFYFYVYTHHTVSLLESQLGPYDRGLFNKVKCCVNSTDRYRYDKFWNFVFEVWRNS